MADILTNILPSKQFKNLLCKLGVFILNTLSLRGDVKYKDVTAQAQSHMNTKTTRVEDMSRADSLHKHQSITSADEVLLTVSRIMYKSLLG